MKKLILLLGFGLSLNAFAGKAPVAISCVDTNKDEMSLKLETRKYANSHGRGVACYKMTMDEAMSINLVGAIGGEEGTDLCLTTDAALTKKSRKDVLSAWDGNTGAKVYLPKGTMTGKFKLGKEFKAKVTVYYQDVTDDEKTSALTCTVDE